MKDKVMTENIIIFVGECDAIPTLSQWFVILLCILLVIFGTVSLRSRSRTLQEEL